MSHSIAGARLITVRILGHPRVMGLHNANLDDYSNAILSAPTAAPIVEEWLAKLEQPFAGITTDGTRREGLFELGDEGAPAEEMVCIPQATWKDETDRELQLAAATRLRDALSPAELASCSHPIDSDNW